MINIRHKNAQKCSTYHTGWWQSEEAASKINGITTETAQMPHTSVRSKYCTNRLQPYITPVP